MKVFNLHKSVEAPATEAGVTAFLAPIQRVVFILSMQCYDWLLH